MALPGPDDFAHLAPDEQWAQALHDAPRHLFVPDVAWTTTHGLIDRAAEPEAWHAAVTSTEPIITQIDDGNTELTNDSPWQHVHNWTSSCSAPHVVFAFLGLLDPYPGDRVLEIGTGTGWTAALLSARLGSTNVTSVEVDDQVAKQAAANLERTGFTPTLIVGDGAESWPDDAPFDRVHVTCGVREIPYAWVEQTRPGGVIVTPWMPNPGHGGHKLRLTVVGDHAVGRLCGGAAYMLLRDQRLGHPPIEGEPRPGFARVDPRRVARAGPGLRVALAGLLPDVSVGGADHPDGSHRMALQHVPSGSHALAVRQAERGDVEVKQRGPRNLWEELEAAYLTWVSWGEPECERFGLTVDVAGQHVWLDYPDNPISEVES